MIVLTETQKWASKFAPRSSSREDRAWVQYQLFSAVYFSRGTESPPKSYGKRALLRELDAVLSLQSSVVQ